MTPKQKLDRAVSALRSLHQMLNTKLPNSIHQTYIDEVLVDIGEKKGGQS